MIGNKTSHAKLVPPSWVVVCPSFLQSTFVSFAGWSVFVKYLGNASVVHF